MGTFRCTVNVKRVINIWTNNEKKKRRKLTHIYPHELTWGFDKKRKKKTTTFARIATQNYDNICPNDHTKLKFCLFECMFVRSFVHSRPFFFNIHVNGNSCLLIWKYVRPSVHARSTIFSRFMLMGFMFAYLDVCSSVCSSTINIIKILYKMQNTAIHTQTQTIITHTHTLILVVF